MATNAKLGNKTLIISLRIAITALVLVCGSYAFFRRNDYFAGDGGMMHLGIVALLYVAMLVLVWWKNTLSDKTNLICSAIVCGITPFLCYIMVECANSDWSCLFVDGAGLSIRMHLLNLFIYVFFLALIIGLTASLRISTMITYLFFGILGAAQYYVCIFRGMGFVAGDLSGVGAARNVAGGYDFNPNFWMFIAISLMLFGLILSSRFKGQIVKGAKKRIVLICCSILVAGAFMYTYFFMPFTKNQRVKLYKPQDTYLEKGSMFAFVRSWRYLIMDKPKGYSLEAVRAIADRYSEDIEPSEINAKETPNLILVMVESLSDVVDIGGGKVTTNIDNLPIIHNLKDDTVHGTLLEERCGGGTAIMECEMLTGATNAFFPMGTVVYQTLIKTETPSLASQLKDNGYQGIIASHPHFASGYNRVNAYPLLGFEELRFKKEISQNGHRNRYGRYLSDRAGYNELIDEYEEAKSKSDAPFFAFQVTMQNHAPYDMAETDDVRITSKDTYDKSVEQYMNYAYASDTAFGNFIEYFKNTDDPTLVVIFGDHAPRFDVSYYQKILDIDTEPNSEQSMLLYKTPLVMWANYDIPEENLGDTADPYISAKIIELLGLKQTGFQRFVQDFQKEIPVINSLGYKDKDGKYYRIKDTSSPYYELINEYNMLVYNNLVDTDNRIEGFFD